MEYLRKILSFLAGLAAGGFAMHIRYSRRSYDNNVRQGRINAGGDVAGRDIKK